MSGVTFHSIFKLKSFSDSGIIADRANLLTSRLIVGVPGSNPGKRCWTIQFNVLMSKILKSVQTFVRNIESYLIRSWHML